MGNGLLPISVYKVQIKMKKHLITLSVILFSFAIYSCKDKDAFTISGEIKNPGSVKKVFLLRADTSVAVIDSI